MILLFGLHAVMVVLGVVLLLSGDIVLGLLFVVIGVTILAGAIVATVGRQSGSGKVQARTGGGPSALSRAEGSLPAGTVPS
jgi:hypothetical protein